MYILVLKNSHQTELKFLKMPSLYETFCESRCYSWCCKELLNGMIRLTSSSQVAITSMTNFPCLLMFNFQYTVFFFNIFATEVTAVLAKISVCIFFWDLAESHTFISACFYQFLISNCSWCYFFKKVSFRLPYLSLCLESRLSLCIIWRGKTPGKLSKTPGKLLKLYLVKMSDHTVVSFGFICIRVWLTIVSSLGINTLTYNLSSVGGSSLLT